MPIVTRFAPSPTGYLHLGHVRNAIEVWTFARERGGRVLLRIEDHDRQRCKPEYEAAIREDLAWLGFEPDEEVPRQSTRGREYRDALEPLIRRGLVYGCSCSRHDIGGARYTGACRNAGIALGDDVSWRVRIDPGVERFVDLRLGPQEQDPSQQCGDVIVRDRLGNWTYQWAVTVDDFLQGVTHVVRGEDLVDSTGRQIRLARLIGRVDAPEFLHHSLILRGDGRKLSKSDGDTGIRDLRNKGFSKEAVFSMALHGE